MSAAHTPAPWGFDTGDSVVHILDAQGGRLAVTDTKRYYQRHDATDIANARLIAAAPDLLKACADWIEWLEPDSPWREDAADHEARMLDAMRAAIAKALGCTPNSKDDEA